MSIPSIPSTNNLATNPGPSPADAAARPAFLDVPPLYALPLPPPGPARRIPSVGEYYLLTRLVRYALWELELMQEWACHPEFPYDEPFTNSWLRSRMAFDDKGARQRDSAAANPAGDAADAGDAGNGADAAPDTAPDTAPGASGKPTVFWCAEDAEHQIVTGELPIRMFTWAGLPADADVETLVGALARRPLVVRRASDQGPYAIVAVRLAPSFAARGRHFPEEALARCLAGAVGEGAGAPSGVSYSPPDGRREELDSRAGAAADEVGFAVAGNPGARVQRLTRAVRDAFGRLEEEGIRCQAENGCCLYSGFAAIFEGVCRSAPGYDGFAFYTTEDLAHARQTGGLYLAFGSYAHPSRSVGVGQRVAAALRAGGLAVDWDGTFESRVHVRLRAADEGNAGDGAGEAQRG